MYKLYMHVFQVEGPCMYVKIQREEKRGKEERGEHLGELETIALASHPSYAPVYV